MHLLLYLEAVQVLEKELKNNEFRISKFYSMQTWYCVTLLLFMGIIDQQTKNEKIIDKEEVEKTVGLKDRFFRVMSKLDESEQNIFLTTYLPEKKTFNNFKEVCDHLYGTRNFFAHDIENLDDSVPQTEYLSFSKSLDGQYVMHPNLHHGQLFMLVIVAILRYLNYQNKLTILTTRPFNLRDRIV